MSLTLVDKIGCWTESEMLRRIQLVRQAAHWCRANARKDDLKSLQASASLMRGRLEAVEEIVIGFEKRLGELSAASSEDGESA